MSVVNNLKSRPLTEEEKEWFKDFFNNPDKPLTDEQFEKAFGEIRPSQQSSHVATITITPDCINGFRRLPPYSSATTLKKQ